MFPSYQLTAGSLPAVSLSFKKWKRFFFDAVMITVGLTEIILTVWITNCMGWWELKSSNASLFKKKHSHQTNALRPQNNESQQLCNLLLFKNNTLSSWKIMDKYFLLPVLCLWDKVRQLKYLVLMQNYTSRFTLLQKFPDCVFSFILLHKSWSSNMGALLSFSFSF